MRVEGISDFTVAHVESLLFCSEKFAIRSEGKCYGKNTREDSENIVCFIRNMKNLSKISIAKK